MLLSRVQKFAPFHHGTHSCTLPSCHYTQTLGGCVTFKKRKFKNTKFVFSGKNVTILGILGIGYQNDPDGTRNDFDQVSKIGPMMWSQVGKCANFVYHVGSKYPKMGPPNQALSGTQEFLWKWHLFQTIPRCGVFLPLNFQPGI